MSLPHTSENLVSGVIIEALPSAMFRVKVGDQIVLGHLSGKMRIHYIKVMPGDTVSLRLSPDGKRGIIMRRGLIRK
ncbi:MAG: translation initiation factor IF-1 [Patescibacteria group bacterium]|nr:translation initiation factor IF-1 [Patescibacteria group bacterium]